MHKKSVHVVALAYESYWETGNGEETLMVLNAEDKKEKC